MSGKLKEVKNRIASVKSTQQITKAMKLVAASKLKKATDMILQIRPYEEKLSDMLRNIAAATKGELNLSLATERPVNSVLIVVITSDKGLCGAFNTNVVKQATQAIDKYSDKKVTVQYIGKKGSDALKKRGGLEHNVSDVELLKKIEFGSVATVVEKIIEDFSAGTYDKVIVCYSKFKNAAVQEFQQQQFLPIEKNEEENVEEAKSAMKADYIFEPTKNVLVEQLMPKIMKTQFYRFVLDSNASEHGARMTAMESATENANELLNSLKLSYNKARQAAITTELTEIVSGAAALSQS